MYASILVALSLVLSPAQGVCRAAPAPRAAAVAAEPNGAQKPPEFPPLPAKLESRAAIVIDTNAAGEEGEVVNQRIRGKAEGEMQALSLLIGDAPALPQVVTKISALGGDELGWTYTIDIIHSDTPIPGGSFAGECRDCTENELVDRVAGDVRSLLPRLRAYIVDHNAQVDTEARRRDEAMRRWEEEQKTRKPKASEPAGAGSADVAPMHPLCKAGIGLMAGGAVGVGLGLGLVVAKDRFGTSSSCGDPAADPLACTEGRSTHLPGYVALGVGGAVLLTGVALFVVGHRKTRSPNAALAPTFGPGLVGLQWSGRF